LIYLSTYKEYAIMINPMQLQDYRRFKVR